MTEFTKNAMNHLDYYVYLYLDPDTNKVFYVGKGQGNRAFSHLSCKKEHAKAKKIEEIRQRGKEPKIELLTHGLASEEMALKIETAAIDLLGIENLTNKVNGHHCYVSGRMTIQEYNDRHQDESAIISEPALLLQIKKMFRYDMTPHELYEATRGAWALDKKRSSKVKYAFAVYNGIVQEVYEIVSWHPAGTTLYTTRVIEKDNKLEFIGDKAPETIRRQYKGKVISHYIKKGARNSVHYINC